MDTLKKEIAEIIKDGINKILLRMKVQKAMKATNMVKMIMLLQSRLRLKTQR